MPPTPQDRPEIQVFNEIGAIEHYMRKAVLPHLPPGMTYAQWELLGHFVRGGDGQTPAQLADYMMMTRGAITNALQRMEARGYIVVLADVADGRRKRVRIARDGQGAYNDVMKGIRWKSEKLREGFTEAEFHQALPFLKALRTFLAEVSAPGEPSAERRQHL